MLQNKIMTLDEKLAIANKAIELKKAGDREWIFPLLLNRLVWIWV